MATADLSTQVQVLPSNAVIKSVFLFGVPDALIESISLRINGMEVFYVHTTSGCEDSPSMSGGELMGLMCKLEGLQPGQMPLPALDISRWRGVGQFLVQVKLGELPSDFKSMEVLAMVEGCW